MSILEELAALRNIPPFAVLDDKKLKLLAFVSELKRYTAGSVILKQGEYGESAFVIVDGVVEVSILSDDNSPLIREMGRHTFFGEIAVTMNTFRAATITTKTDVDVLKISKNVLHNLIEEVPELATKIEEHIEKSGYVVGG